MKTTTSLLLALLLATGCAGPKYAHSTTSTASLQLRHQQCAEWLQADRDHSQAINISFGAPPLRPGWVHPYQDHVQEKEAIEVELLRRWQSGDPAAYLPIFDPAKPLQAVAK